MKKLARNKIKVNKIGDWEFTCKPCGKQYPTYRKLRVHQRGVHVKFSKRHNCVFCATKFSRKGDIRRHILRHIEERPYTCGICHKEFCLKFGRDAHRRYCEKPKPIKVPKEKPPKKIKGFKCNFCIKKFYAQKYLDAHLHRHEFNTCVFCGANCVNPFHLSDHILRHIKEKPLPCNHCTESFCSVQEVKDHIRRNHTGDDRRFRCDLCLPFRKFLRIESLHRHKIKWHVNNWAKIRRKPEHNFQCVFCEKKFREKDVLETHLLTHIDERPLQCVLCEKSFRTKTTLSSHLQGHTMEKPWKCEICGRGFPRRMILRDHIDRMHLLQDSRFSCTFCDRKLTCKTDHWEHTMQHIEENPFHCKFCGKEFTGKSRLNAHLRSHIREKCIPCEICGDKFHQDSSRRHHQMKHFYKRETIMNKLKCRICGESFETTKSILEHLRIAHKNDFASYKATKLASLLV